MTMNDRMRTRTRVRSVSRGACLMVVAMGACCGTISEAFIPRPSTLHPIINNDSIAQPRTTITNPHATVAKSGAAARAARKGFSRSNAESSPRVSLSKGFGETPIAGTGAGGVKAWEKEYKAYIKRTGQYLCSMSWEGHQEMGRGAVFANYDDARVGDQLNDVDNFGGIPSMYVPLTEFESMRLEGKPGEEDNLEQILRRVKSYRPEEEFVVVFQAKGTMGADVVRPSISPPEMAKYVTRSDGKSSSPVGQAEGESGVIDV